MGKRLILVFVLFTLVMSVVNAQEISTEGLIGVTSVSGYIKTRALWIDEDVTTFRFQEWYLSLNRQLSSKANASVGAYLYGGNQFFLGDAFVDLRNMPMEMSGIWRIGVSRNYSFGLVPTIPNRKTSNYGIVSGMFTEDRVIGVQYLSMTSTIEVNIAAHNSYELGVKTVGEGINTVTFLADSDNTFSVFQRNDNSDSKEVSARIAYISANSFDIGVSGAYSVLPETEIAALNTILGTDYVSDKKIRAGLDFMCTELNPIILQGEIYNGWTSDLKHTAWQALTGYMFKKDNKPFVDIYARYGENNPIIDTNPAIQETWKLRQTVLAVKYMFTPGVSLQLEGEINKQRTRGGAANIPSSAAFLELMFLY